MENKQRLFIYDRKEMGILLILGLMVAAFAFTLGVHLGKRVGPKGMVAEGAHDPETVSTVSDQIPGRQELNEQAKGAQQAADETLNQNLHEEVAKSGIRLDHPKQIQLPDKTRSEHGGATTGATHSNTVAEIKPAEHLVVAESGGHDAKAPAETHAEHATEHVPAPAAEPVAEHPAHPPVAVVPSTKQGPVAHAEIVGGKFTLQIGSYPLMAEARDQSEALEALGLKPVVKPAEVKGKTWYRIFVGGYESHDAAEKAGRRLVSQHMVEGYIVSKKVD